MNVYVEFGEVWNLFPGKSNITKVCKNIGNKNLEANILGSDIVFLSIYNFVLLQFFKIRIFEKCKKTPFVYFV